MIITVIVLIISIALIISQNPLGIFGGIIGILISIFRFLRLSYRRYRTLEIESNIEEYQESMKSNRDNAKMKYDEFNEKSNKEYQKLARLEFNEMALKNGFAFEFLFYDEKYENPYLKYKEHEQYL